MTDRITDDSFVDDAHPPTGGTPVYEWAPAERQKPRRKRALIWASVAGGAVVIAAAAVAAVTLTAPGTTVAGVAIGGLPASAAADTVTSQLANAKISIEGTTFTGKQLGLEVDAKTLTDKAFAESPLWNVTTWFGAPVQGAVTLDKTTANDALRQAFPQLYQKPVDATVVYSSGAYSTTQAKVGSGADLKALASSIERGLNGGIDHLNAKVTTTPVNARISTDTAKTTATKLNTMLQSIGFYVGTERTVPIAPDTAATWLTVKPDDATGGFTITADQAKIQTAVDALPAEVNRQAVNGEAITDSNGKVLSTLTESKSARVLGDTAGIAKGFATQLDQGKATYSLPVTETPAKTTAITRSIDVNLSTQTVSLIQNGSVVDSWLISSGLPGTATPTGNFKVFVHVREQTMSSEQYGYNVPNVEWVMYFDNNGDAFHGVYWHHNWGSPMSHGCVGMPEYRAEQLYNWTPDGTEVYIHH